MEEQSSNTWQKVLGEVVEERSDTKSLMITYFSQYLKVKPLNMLRVDSKAGHWWRMWKMSSGVEEHSGERRQIPALLFDQLLQSSSVLNLPETIWPWMVHMATLAGELPAVDHIG